MKLPRRRRGCPDSSTIRGDGHGLSVSPKSSGKRTARPAPIVAALRGALGPDRVRDGATELSLYRHDASHMQGAAVAVCFPTSTADVQACVRLAVAHGVPFVARGSGTGLAGGAVPPDGAVVISTTKMNRVLAVDPVGRRAWVEPGVLNLDLTRAVAADGLRGALAGAGSRRRRDRDLLRWGLPACHAGRRKPRALRRRHGPLGDGHQRPRRIPGRHANRRELRRLHRVARAALGVEHERTRRGKARRAGRRQPRRLSRIDASVGEVRIALSAPAVPARRNSVGKPSPVYGRRFDGTSAPLEGPPTVERV